MTVRSYYVDGPFGVRMIVYSNDSTPSPRVGGKLKLVSNVHHFTHSRVTYMRTNFAGNDCQSASTQVQFPWTTAHYNEVYGKFVGKLHKGGASLGVTFGSMGQTVDMIVDRCGKLRDFFSLHRTSKRRRRRRPKREDKFSRQKLASDVLEGEFGWVPLVTDIYHAMVTACSVPDSTWVRASSRFQRYDTDINNGSPVITNVRSGSARCTIAASVTIDNPNVWLLNRLGLINPLTVAWDLVPWSFVVNMFVNLNSLISSLTDFVGLQFNNCSVTYSALQLREQTTEWKNFYGAGKHRTSAVSVVTRTRDRSPVATPPRPALRAKLPKTDWNLAAIASALLVQKVKTFH
jgi:hypothetical protein